MTVPFTAMADRFLELRGLTREEVMAMSYVPRKQLIDDFVEFQEHLRNGEVILTVRDKEEAEAEEQEQREREEDND